MTWSYAADPAITSLPALVRARMKAPDKIFIRNGDGRDFTFDEVWRLAGRLAGALADAGVGIGDRVAVQVDKSPEAIVLFLACARLGAIYPAAQHRLHARRTGLFHRRRRAAA